MDYNTDISRSYNMTIPQPTETITAHWLLRVTLRGSNREPLYVEIADSNQSLERTLGPAWEALHSPHSATIVTQHGNEVDLQQPVGRLAFTSFFAGNDKWAVAEITLKPRPTVSGGEVSVCGDLPLPGASEPSYPSGALVTDDELLACVEEALFVKSIHQKAAFKSTIIATVERVLREKRQVVVEPERVQRAIDTTVRKFGLPTTALRINLTNFLPQKTK